MQLELYNYFRILRVQESVCLQREFNSRLVLHPFRVMGAILMRAVLRPLWQLRQRSCIRERTASDCPENALLQKPRFIAKELKNNAGEFICFETGVTVPEARVPPCSFRWSGSHDRIIFVHAFYEPEAEEIFLQLDEYANYDLILTTSSSVIRDVFLKRYSRRRALCVVVPNQGRDILPFLLALTIVDLPHYQYFIKIHTKRSGHRADGKSWFRMNLKFLLGAHEISDRLFSLINASKPSIYGVECLSIQDHFENNYRWMRVLLGRSINAEGGQFIAGSMFMGTGEFLRKVAQKDLLRYQMEPEYGKLDGTLAHALERYFGWLAGNEGGECSTIESYLLRR